MTKEERVSLPAEFNFKKFVPKLIGYYSNQQISSSDKTTEKGGFVSFYSTSVLGKKTDLTSIKINVSDDEMSYSFSGKRKPYEVLIGISGLFGTASLLALLYYLYKANWMYAGGLFVVFSGLLYLGISSFKNLRFYRDFKTVLEELVSVSIEDAQREQKNKSGTNVRLCKNCEAELEPGNLTCTKCGTRNSKLKQEKAPEA